MSDEEARWHHVGAMNEIGTYVDVCNCEDGRHLEYPPANATEALNALQEQADLAAGYKEETLRWAKRWAGLNDLAAGLRSALELIRQPFVSEQMAHQLAADALDNPQPHHETEPMATQGMMRCKFLKEGEVCKLPNVHCSAPDCMVEVQPHHEETNKAGEVRLGIPDRAAIEKAMQSYANQIMIEKGLTPIDHEGGEG